MATNIASTESRATAEPLDASPALQARSAALGALPLISLITALGLLGVAVAHRLSETGVWDAQLLFWAGVLLIVAPSVARQCSTSASRDERIGLVLLCGMGLFLLKVIASPFAFTFPDEFTHTYNVETVLQTGRLFHPSPLVSVTALYPGLASVTAALASVSGLTVFQAGIMISGLARLLLMTAVFLLVEQVTRSSRAGGLAATLYAGNPNYALYSAEFGYETLALPLAVLVVFAAARRASLSSRAERAGWSIVALLAILTVVVTHHVTSYALAATLIAATAVGVLFARRAGWVHASIPWDLAIAATVSVGVWLLEVGGSTTPYLSNVFTLAAQQGLAALLSGQPARQLFQAGSSGLTSPLWQQLTGFAWLLVVALGLGFGLLTLRRQASATPLGIVLLLAAAAFLPVQALRLTPASWETANRSSEFLFLGCAVVLALTAIRLEKWRPMLIVGGTLVLVGGFIVGWSYVVQLPPPYLVGATDGRDIEPEGATDASWSLQYLGPDNVVALDPSNSLMMAAYGQQRTFTGSAYGIQAMFLSPSADTTVEDIIHGIDARYIVVDKRARSWNATYGFYPPGGASPLGSPSPLLDEADYAKFDSIPGLTRFLDSGNIVIYAVGAVPPSSRQP